MVDVLILLWTALTSLLRSRGRLEAEILVLRQQINVLRHNSPKRAVFRTFDRLVFVALYRLTPTIVDVLAIVRPETVVRWHCTGFRSFWRWKSRRRGGRPRVPLEIRRLIRDMSLANPLWGAPRIHGELVKLGIDVGQTSVAKVRGPEEGRAVTGLEDLSLPPLLVQLIFWYNLAALCLRRAALYPAELRVHAAGTGRTIAKGGLGVKRGLENSGSLKLACQRSDSS